MFIFCTNTSKHSTGHLQNSVKSQFYLFILSNSAWYLDTQSEPEQNHRLMLVYISLIHITYCMEWPNIILLAFTYLTIYILSSFTSWSRLVHTFFMAGIFTNWKEISTQYDFRYQLILNSFILQWLWHKFSQLTDSMTAYRVYYQH